MDLGTFKQETVKASGVAGGFVLLADLAQPIAPFAAYFAGGSAISALILGMMCLYDLFGKGKRLLAAFFLSVVIFLLSVGLWLFQDYFGANETGILGGNIAVISDFQQVVGIAEKIAKDTEIIKDNTEIIKGDTGEIKNIIKDARVFLGAINRGDVEVIKLFNKDEFHVDVYNPGLHLADEFPTLTFFNLPNSTFVEVLDVLKEKGYMKPNKTFRNFSGMWGIRFMQFPPIPDSGYNLKDIKNAEITDPEVQEMVKKKNKLISVLDKKLSPNDYEKQKEELFDKRKRIKVLRVFSKHVSGILGYFKYLNDLTPDSFAWEFEYAKKKKREAEYQLKKVGLTILLPTNLEKLQTLIAKYNKEFNNAWSVVQKDIERYDSRIKKMQSDIKQYEKNIHEYKTDKVSNEYRRKLQAAIYSTVNLLTMAVWSGDAKKVEYLQKWGEKADAKVLLHGEEKTALSEAKRIGNKAMVSVLKGR